jgi:hypothetical protein
VLTGTFTLSWGGEMIVCENAKLEIEKITADAWSESLPDGAR